MTVEFDKSIAVSPDSDGANSDSLEFKFRSRLLYPKVLGWEGALLVRATSGEEPLADILATGWWPELPATDYRIGVDF